MCFLYILFHRKHCYDCISKKKSIVDQTNKTVWFSINTKHSLHSFDAKYNSTQTLLMHFLCIGNVLLLKIGLIKFFFNIVPIPTTNKNREITQRYAFVLFF
jgi:hypothetical protein